MGFEPKAEPASSLGWLKERGAGVSRSARLRIAHDRIRRVSGGPDPSRSVTDTRETNGSLRIASCGQPVFADPNHRTAPTLRYEVNCRRPIAHARGNRSDKITGVIQARSCARQMHAESDNISFYLRAFACCDASVTDL